MALTRQSTGWTDLTSASGFTPHSDINGSLHHMEDVTATTADTPADLPASGNWPARRIFSLDVGRFYFWNGSVWVRENLTVGGVATITGDANARVTVTHGLGSTPLAAWAVIADDTPTIGNLLKANIDSLTATTFRVRFYRLDNQTPYALNSVKFHWGAVG